MILRLRPADGEPPDWSIGKYLAFEFAKAAVAAVAAEGIRLVFERWRAHRDGEDQ